MVAYKELDFGLPIVWEMRDWNDFWATMVLNGPKMQFATDNYLLQTEHHVANMHQLKVITFPCCKQFEDQKFFSKPPNSPQLIKIRWCHITTQVYMLLLPTFGILMSHGETSSLTNSSRAPRKSFVLSFSLFYLDYCASAIITHITYNQSKSYKSVLTCDFNWFPGHIILQ